MHIYIYIYIYTHTHTHTELFTFVCSQASRTSRAGPSCGRRTPPAQPSGGCFDTGVRELSTHPTCGQRRTPPLSPLMSMFTDMSEVSAIGL